MVDQDYRCSRLPHVWARGSEEVRLYSLPPFDVSSIIIYLFCIHCAVTKKVSMKT